MRDRLENVRRRIGFVSESKRLYPCRAHYPLAIPAREDLKQRPHGGERGTVAFCLT